MSTLRTELGRLALVMLLAFVTRAAFVIVWQATHDPQQFEFPDSAGYWELGHDLAAGAPYEVGSPDRQILRGPGYPLLLAPLLKALGPTASPAAARWLGAAIGTLAVGAVFWLARLMFDSSVALWAALIVAVYPETILVSVLPLSDGPFCLWMVLQLALWQWAVNANSAKASGGALLAGAIGGIATLTRPSWLLFSPVFAALWTLGSRFNLRQFSLALLMLAGLVAVMTPWWVRSFRITGHFVPTVLWVGPSLYDGLNPNANGSSNMSFVPEFEAKLREMRASAENPNQLPTFEYQFDVTLRDAALQWTRENPGRVLQLAAVKLGRMWNVWPNEPAFRQWWVRGVMAATYVPLMLLAVVGAWHIRRRGLALLLLLSPVVYFSLLHAVFIGSLRYRQPALMTLAILAAVAIDALTTRSVSANRAKASA